MTPTTKKTETAPKPLSEVMSRADVLATFGITPPTLCAWIKAGRFPAPARPSGYSRGRAFWHAEAVRAVLADKHKAA